LEKLIKIVVYKTVIFSDFHLIFLCLMQSVLMPFEATTDVDCHPLYLSSKFQE